MSAVPAFAAPRHRLPWRRLLCVVLCCLPMEAEWPAHAQQANPINTPAQSAISGTVVDQNGNFLLAARVSLTRPGQTEEKTQESDGAGHFVFNAISPGPFQLTVTGEGFATQQVAGVVHPGEVLEVPLISLPIAAATTEVRVSVTNYELAEEQVKIEEKQRVLGVIPNFYVSYQQDALPLRPKQKFELAWKSSIDPVTLAATGAVAGIQQAQNEFSGYGQGARGYAKRYGASYGDAVIGTVIGGAILPSLLKQDPRYFYKGTGSTRSRVLYALANAVICKGDNGHWQFDYSGILGALAAGGISNLYYPASSRNGAGLTLENTLIGIGGSGVANLFQEFLIRKLTPHAQSKP
ncbi:MAG: carboxypeptidase-like regulatory domain-containing protein [Acidobacteriaceae bacterium]